MTGSNEDWSSVLAAKVKQSEILKLFSYADDKEEADK